ncbi:MAG TPA: lipopolysaccharide heptosyltransferase I [Pseudolabrys sp.]|nr:lipopolysaccharide heptosyltransferase I [Pseudolabrys sp.]
MTDILFIKTSSLGDVIHHMPALTEARLRRPDARFAWLVEEAFAPLVRLHSAVDKVVPVAWRRWRKSLWSRATLGEIADNMRAIRAECYDDIIDTQGLLRSALIARLPSGRRHGYDRRSIREPLASAFYDVRYGVSRDLHAVERNRTLTGRVLGYQPQGMPDFGLNRSRLRREGARYAVLLHATARPEKEWPEESWVALGTALAREGYDLVLPWGSFAEKARADRMAASLPRASVPERQPLDSVARLMASAELVVGVDTGLMHLAAALGVPLVAIFTGSKPHLTRPVGNGPMVVLGAHGASPDIDEARAAVLKLPR